VRERAGVRQRRGCDGASEHESPDGRADPDLPERPPGDGGLGAHSAAPYWDRNSSSNDGSRVVMWRMPAGTSARITSSIEPATLHSMLLRSTTTFVTPAIDDRS